ncbi:MAG: DUF1998 domain-containing protein [Magnetospirillum sp.]|nr:DUF1998 domain-containing protein [Magnetospirillum sp.]
MARNLQRLSQLITTFGPGAMLDLPTRSVLIGGLERWDMRERAFTAIDERRLAEMIERNLKKTGRLEETRTLSLRTPPLAVDIAGREPPGVAVTVFPTWFVCEAEAQTTEGGGIDTRRRRLVRWQELNPANGRRQFELESGKKVDVTPIRFVAGCEKGHLQDIDWRRVVHGPTECREAMWLVERGTSADPRDTLVECDCGKSLSLEQAFAPHRLGTCRGDRPWLGDRDPAGCTNPLRFLTRTATNTYFPQIATVISLPSGEDALSRLVQTHFDDLAAARSAEDIGLARRFNRVLAASFEGYADTDVFARLQLFNAQVQQDASAPPRLAEFAVFASGHPVIGENLPESKLFAETLPREAWDANHAPVCRGIRSLVAVHRLREVSCLYGFTRFEAAPTSTDGELEDVQLAVDGAPLSLGADWLPAVEQFGEGLFIHFDEAAITEWLGREAVGPRARQLLGGYERWAELRGDRRAPNPGLVYTMLHSLSHVLMAEIALECGYPASALKERIYALANPLRRNHIDSCGILVYTATSGNQGTLGGLVATSARFATILTSALDRLEVCSNDPICADHEPASSADDRALHGAACHGCLLIAETSCENRNLFLDRSLLVETMAGLGAGFFSLD